MSTSTKKGSISKLSGNRGMRPLPGIRWKMKLNFMELRYFLQSESWPLSISPQNDNWKIRRKRTEGSTGKPCCMPSVEHPLWQRSALIHDQQRREGDERPFSLIKPFGRWWTAAGRHFLQLSHFQACSSAQRRKVNSLFSLLGELVHGLGEDQKESKYQYFTHLQTSLE